MSVAVNTDSATLQARIPEELFQSQPFPLSSGKNIYVPSPDGQRFLMLAYADEAKSEPITVVANWPSQLRQSSGK